MNLFKGAIIGSLVLFAALNAHAEREGREGGGMPYGEAKADVNLKCEARLSLYLVDGSKRSSGEFVRSIELKVKKGTRISMSNRIGESMERPSDWALDAAQSENPDMLAFERFLKVKYAFSVGFRLADYSKTDVVDVEIWMDLPERAKDVPNQDVILTQRTHRLSASDFDISAMYKDYTSPIYSASKFSVNCKSVGPL